MSERRSAEARGFLVPFTLVAGIVSASLSGAASWKQGAPPAPGLPDRTSHAMAFDASRGRVVIFGGGAGSNYYNDTWEYDGSFYQGPTAPPALTPRAFTAMAYDSARRLVVLYGGFDNVTGFKGDTWEYNGTTWTLRVFAPPVTPPLQLHAMAYDAARARIVIFGGQDDTGTYRNDTWEYDGSSWTAGGAAPPGLTPRQRHAMAYDAARRRVVVFGGWDIAAVRNDTWEYDGAWRAGPAAPAGLSERLNHAMAYDAALGRIVMFGGSNPPSSYFNDTWLYDGVAWTAGPPAPSGLTQRVGHAMAYDAARRVIVLHGGADLLAERDTWEFGPVVDYIVGEGLGQPNPNRVRVFTGAGASTSVAYDAYAAGQWGVNVAGGDVDAGFYAEIVTAPGPGSVLGPQVRGFRRDGTAIAKINYYAYGTLSYGANVTAGGVDGDPFSEILTGPGPGAPFGPHVRGWNYDGSAIAAISKISFFAYSTLQYGVNVAAGGVDGDAFAEILTGPGPSGAFAPQVRGFNYDAASITAIAKINYNAFNVLQYGVNLASGDVDGDGFAEIGCTPGPGPASSFPSRFRGWNYDGAAIGSLAGFDRTPFATYYGGRVGLADVSGNGRDDLLAGAGRDPSADSRVLAYSYNGSLQPVAGAFTPFGTDRYGVNPTGGDLGY